MSHGDRRQPQEQRARILRAAAALIAAESYHGMTMRKLARAAGTSLANVYNYFASKEEILFALHREAFETLLAATGEVLADVSDPAGRLYGFISHHVHYFADHPDVMRVLVHQAAALPARKRRAVRRLKERYFEIGRDVVRDAVEAGGRRLEDEAELERLTYSLFGMLNWIYGWYRPPVHGGPRQLARTIYEVALCGLVARSPHRQVEDRLEAHLANLGMAPLLGAGPPQVTAERHGGPAT